MSRNSNVTGCHSVYVCPLTSRTTNCLNKRHVNSINVGMLLSVQFDVNKVFIHDSCNSWILEGLSFHYMTPVTVNEESNQLVINIKTNERMDNNTDNIEKDKLGVE